MKENGPLTETNSEPLQIERDPSGNLILLKEGARVAVTLRPCFPWSQPEGFLSLRDSEGEEAAFLPSLDGLATEVREAVAAALKVSRFTLEITSIESVRTDFELRVWKVDTLQGKRTFQTRLEEWPMELPDQSIIIRDLAGDLYHIPDPKALDRKSYTRLWAFIE